MTKISLLEIFPINKDTILVSSRFRAHQSLHKYVRSFKSPKSIPPTRYRMNKMDKRNVKLSSPETSISGSLYTEIAPIKRNVSRPRL